MIYQVSVVEGEGNSNDTSALPTPYCLGVKYMYESTKLLAEDCRCLRYYTHPDCLYSLSFVLSSLLSVVCFLISDLCSLLAQNTHTVV